MRRDGYPAYITSAGWMGYPDEKVRALCRQALADGFTRFKIKVGRDDTSTARKSAPSATSRSSWCRISPRKP